jgi:hypothetical protein
MRTYIALGSPGFSSQFKSEFWQHFVVYREGREGGIQKIIYESFAARLANALACFDVERTAQDKILTQFISLDRNVSGACQLE